MFDILFFFNLSMYLFLTLFYLCVSRHLTSTVYLKLILVTLAMAFLSFLLLIPTIFLKEINVSLILNSPFVSVATVPCSLSFFIDPLSYSFAALVMVIGLATNFYTLNYFKGEANEKGFLFWLNAFIISMLCLVFAGNFFTVFLGWELIGLTSFFLINFWNGRRATMKSSFKAFTFNLISDLCLMGAFAIFFTIYRNDDLQSFLYLTIFTQTPISQGGFFATILLGVAASLKSVQIVAHAWLPDSMEAPVPASSLIHSATLVSAGIYLLSRFHYLLLINNLIYVFVIIGAITAFYGGLVASSQTDLKKLLAYSTMSHCGFLWILASLGNMYITILYLVLHGVFKAATFYFAGSLIRFYGTQDSRWMGGGLFKLPADSVFFIFSALNLCGLPFSFGFFYKTFMLKLVLINNISFLVLGLILIAALTSILYFFKLISGSLFDFDKTVKNNYQVWFNKTPVYIYKGRTVQFTAILGFVLLILFTVFFLNCWHFFYNTNVLSQHTFVVSQFLEFYVKTELFYNSIYLFFYLIYIFLISWFIMVPFRSNTFLLNTHVSVLYLLLICLFKCELTLWLMSLH